MMNMPLDMHKYVNSVTSLSLNCNYDDVETCLVLVVKGEGVRWIKIATDYVTIYQYTHYHNQPIYIYQAQWFQMALHQSSEFYFPAYIQ